MREGNIMPLNKVCIVEYGSRVVHKRDGGSIYPVYGGGGATFKMNMFNRENRIVIARFGMSKQCTRLVNKRFFLNDSGLTVSSKSESILLQRFLDYQILFLNDVIFSLGKGSAQKNLNVPTFRSLPIFVPNNIKKQEQIVHILDEVFKAIDIAKANTKKNLQNARALLESYLDEIFSQRQEGWHEKKLNEVCAITSILIDPRKPEFFDLTHVGAANIKSQTGNLVELKTAREEGLISGKFQFDKSMVLYSKIRPYLMKVARPDFNGLCSADIYPLKPFMSQITRNFLFYLLTCNFFTNYAIQGSDRAGMPKVNRNHLFNFTVYLPPLNIQKMLEKKLDKIHSEIKHLESIYQQKLTALEELKKSLLHQAFTGNL
jgi:type I restriction enzyme, S subunit